MKLYLTGLLFAGCLAMAGCGGTAAAIPTGPLSLTKEQSEAISQEDSRVQQEEGGAFLAKLAKAKKK